MTDSRLDSLHLPMPRRMDFRRAREGLLEARGDLTVMAERRTAPPPPPVKDRRSDTIRQDLGEPSCLELDHWLVDQDNCIYPLKVGLNTLGRAPENDVVVKDAFTSRRHCAILVHVTEGCELHDIASKNGTFINGVRLGRPTRLRVGDEIRICDQRFTFQSRHEAADGRYNETLAK